MRASVKRVRRVPVKVNDLMQRAYVYYLTEPEGRKFHADFKPELTPREMLELGVFGGKYMTDCRKEFPASWFSHAKLNHERHDPKLNFFKVIVRTVPSIAGDDNDRLCFTGLMTRERFELTPLRKCYYHSIP